MTKQKFTTDFKKAVIETLDLHNIKYESKDLENELNYKIERIIENTKITNITRLQIVPHGDYKQLNTIFEISFDAYIDYKNGYYSKHYVFLIVDIEKDGE